MKIVLFDFDGVIANTFHIAYDAMQSEGFLDGISKEEFRNHFETNIYDQDLGKKLLKAKLDKYNPFFAKYAPGLYQMPPKDGMPEVIKTLSEKYDLFVVSSTINDVLEEYLIRNDLLKYFKAVFGADYDTSKSKKIQHIIDEFDSSKEEMVFITDTVGDIREAKKVGVESIAVSWGYQHKEQVLKGEPMVLVDEPNDIVREVEKYLK